MSLTSIVEQKQLRALTNLLVHATRSAQGEVWECGVYLGGSASIITEVLQVHNLNRTIRLFDSFQGLPTPHKNDNHHRAGDFKINSTIEESIKKYFSKYENVLIHKGWVPDTFAGLENSVISFCHLDLDLYEGYVKTLEFVWPRMPTGGIIVFDDYGFTTCLGATKAVDEFVESNNIKLYKEDTKEQAATWIVKP